MSCTDGRITTVAELEEVLGLPDARAAGKGRERLVELDRRWLAASSFCLVATADCQGRCDVSPKGDPAGSLVHVIDDRTIALAERPGNRRADGYRNILSNPHVGLEFVITGRGDSLRINGKARLVMDSVLADALAVRSQRPALIMVVDIEEVFFHCSKAFLRGGVWKPNTWRPNAVDRRAVIAREVEHDPRSVDALDEYYEENNYAARLY